MPSAEDFVAAFLRANDRDAYCAGCLASRTGLGVRETEEAMVRLGREAEFIIERTRCARCGVTDDAIRVLRRARGV